MVNFNNILPIDGDQRAGFEEFICQLAEEFICQLDRKGNNSKFVKFTRLGNPDGGLECYWTLDDGSIIGWQAKYFMTSFGSSQWNQIERSIKNAINNYKDFNLKKIIVAVPIDAPIESNKKREEKINKWKEFENAHSDLEIDFWGKSEIIKRVSTPDMVGFKSFWFGELELPNHWFEEWAKNNILNFKNKYTPNLSIKTDNEKYFNSLSRNESFREYFFNEIKEYWYSLQDYHQSCNNKINKLNLEELNDLNFKSNFESNIEEIKQILLHFEERYFQMDKLDIDKIKHNIENISNLSLNLEKIIDSLHDNTEKDDEELLKNLYFSNIHFKNSLNQFKSFLESEEVNVINNPFIIFDGEAGIGKSFLFVQTLDEKIKNGENCILLFGHQFSISQNPKITLMDELGFRTFNFDNLLDALECKAKIQESRVLILIDALNESINIKLWNEYLSSFLNSIVKRKWIGCALSIRKEYVDDLEIHEKIDEIISKVTLEGFRYNTQEAILQYFDYYKIPVNNHQLFHHEFYNPLFLKLYCETISNDCTINDLNGLVNLFEAYFGLINKNLSRIHKYSNEINLVKKSLLELIKNGVYRGLKFEKAYEIILNFLKDYNFADKFLNSLIDEGLLVRSKGGDIESIYIAFQLLADYLKVDYLLKDKNFEDFCNSFIKDQDSGVISHPDIEFPVKILNMLSIYIPENYNIELYDLLDEELKSEFDVMNSFIQSLKWRKDSINEKVVEYINNYILKDNFTTQTFLETLISLSHIENHLFNSYRTHEMLKCSTLSERDAFWTIFLHNQNYKKSEVNNLLNFAFLENHEYYSDETLKLASIMISWFLSTTNKKLRDKSTYALINLLKNKLSILKELLQLFEDVNDPYILERLYAASYGCVLNSKDYESLESLSNYIYEAIFNQEIVYPHILIRDYARNIVEFSLSKNCEFNDEIAIVKEKITPPYPSEFPKIPSDEEIEKYKTKKNAVKKIFSSMCVEHNREGKPLMYGYFGRYVFQSCFKLWEKFLRENNIYYLDLMNIALDKIFKSNYNEEIHGSFDEYDVVLYEHKEFTERIGKKYQWISLYELLAQVSDKFPTIHEDYISNEKNIPYQGPWQDNIRNIDPTIICIKKLPKINLDFEEKYPPDNFLNDVWIEYIEDLPKFYKLIESNIEIGKTSFNGLILEAYLTWIRHPEFAQEEYPKKEIWCQIRSYIVKSNDFNKIAPILKHKDFYGRYMPESYENYNIFNKEFYQSIAFDYFYDNGWDEKHELNLNNNKYNLDVTTSKYSGSERSELVNKNYIKINRTIFDDLNLKYGEENSFIYDENNNLIGFDIGEFDDVRNSAFIFKKEILLEYLKENDLKIFFTILGEKMIIGRNGIDTKKQTFSGFYSFKDNDTLKGDIAPYSKCYFGELKTSAPSIVKEIENNMNNTFKKKLYVDYNNKITYLFIETKNKEFPAKKDFTTIETIENYKWNIYSLDKNKIGNEYLKFVSNQVGEIGDSYLIYCKINEKYYNLIVTSAFEERNSNRSKLYQQFIKSLLLNMRIK